MVKHDDCYCSILIDSRHSFAEAPPNVLRFSGGAPIDREDTRAVSAFKIALISRARSAGRCKRLLGHPLRCQITFRTPVGMRDEVAHASGHDVMALQLDEHARRRCAYE